MAPWHRARLLALPVHWVLTRDPKGSLRCTDLNLETGPVQEDFVRRWQLEAAFKDVRAHLSEETQRQWTEVVTSEPWQEQGA